MTAVGKAFISSWLVEEIFDMHFHPDLDQALSMQLKQIQLNIRKFAPQFQSSEEEEALHAKIIAWRLATLEGLQIELRTSQAQNNRLKLVETLNERLIASLSMHLQEPAPPDLKGGVPMIIELAVGIAAHLPMESRDVIIEYFPPGFSIDSEVMKIESGIPALTSPLGDLPDSGQADRASLKSSASDLKDPEDAQNPNSQTTSPNAPSQQQQQQQPLPGKEDKRSRGMLAGFMGSRKPAPQSVGKNVGASGSQTSLTQQPSQPPGSSSGPKEDTGPPRVRIAVGLALQVRGRSVLTKCPVYTM